MDKGAIHFQMYGFLSLGVIDEELRNNLGQDLCRVHWLHRRIS